MAQKPQLMDPQAGVATQPQVPDAQGIPAYAIRFPINENSTDAEQILAFLEQVKQQYIRVSFIREFTVGLLRGLSNNDLVGQANRIIAFVRQNLTYVRDPIDSEYVIAPDKLLQSWVSRHYMAGDCDDHTLLLNTMLGTLGFDTKFVGVKFGDTDVFNHVISGVEIDGQLFLVDPCYKKPGLQPKYKETLILP